jgi:hypothetical protein
MKNKELRGARLHLGFTKKCYVQYLWHQNHMVTFLAIII